MKVLFFIGSLGLGGAEEQVLNLANEYLLLGQEVAVFTMIDVNPRSHLKYSFPIIECHAKKSALGVLRVIFALHKVLREFRPDVLHSHLYHANMISRILKMTISPASVLVNTSHSSNEGGRLRMLAYRLTSRAPVIWTNVSQSAVDRFVRVGAVSARRMRVMHNGINLRNFSRSPEVRVATRGRLGLKDDDFVFIAVGRFVHAKDYPTMVRAFCKVHKGFVKSKLIIVGDGELRADVLKIVEDNALGEAVSLLGARYDVADLLNAADCFVSTSLWEGFGISIAEAMALELPIAATDSGGVRDVIGSEYDLIASGEINSFADKMIEIMLMTVEERSKLGLMLRSRVEQCFSLPAIANQWLKLYREASL